MSKNLQDAIDILSVLSDSELIKLIDEAMDFINPAYQKDIALRYLSFHDHLKEVESTEDHFEYFTPKPYQLAEMLTIDNIEEILYHIQFTPLKHDLYLKLLNIANKGIN